MTQVSVSDEMASTLGLAAGGAHTRDEVGSAALGRFGGDATAEVPADVLAELVVLLDSGGCEDLDASAVTACAVGEASDDELHGSVRAIAGHICGELAMRHHAP